MRIEEGETFLRAFHNRNAKLLVQKMMKNNYLEAIIEHHPNKASIEKALVREKCNGLVDEILKQIEHINDKPDELFKLFHKLSRNNPDKNSIWFNEFTEAYQNYKHNRKLTNRLKQLQPFLDGNSYCDIGCGGGDLIVFLKKNYPQFTECAGIDVLDWRTDSFKEEINFQMLDFTQPDVKSSVRYDTLTCLAVLHHVGNTNQEISIFLKNIRTAINSNGKLIIEEDVILPHYQTDSNDDYREQLNELVSHQPLFAEFLTLEEEEQRAVIILIDFLANCLSVGVPDMAFPCGFKTINEWIGIFKKNNYNVEEVRIQGFVEGNFNRSPHVFFVLTLNDQS
jgi:cyclopropane fatty-acyl-phospholipid synthase-like methyltransferase